jgi:hypothetical protein
VGIGISKGVIGVRGVLWECIGAVEVPGVGAPGVEAERLGDRSASATVAPAAVVAGSRGLRDGLVELGFNPREVALIKT